jgi:hypothetical protein
MVHWCCCAARRDRGDRGTHGGCGAEIGVISVAAHQKRQCADGAQAKNDVRRAAEQRAPNYGLK